MLNRRLRPAQAAPALARPACSHTRFAMHLTSLCCLPACHACRERRNKGKPGPPSFLASRAAALPTHTATAARPLSFASRVHYLLTDHHQHYIPAVKPFKNDMAEMKREGDAARMMDRVFVSAKPRVEAATGMYLISRASPGCQPHCAALLSTHTRWGKHCLGSWRCWPCAQRQSKAPCLPQG